MVDWHNFRMHFPKDAVLVRTLSLAGRRLETQLLHFDGVDWQPYTFAWRDDQTDADLVPADGAEKEVRLAEAEARCGSSTAAASACRATATGRNTRWRSCPSS